MTTIACNRMEMACDTLMTSEYGNKVLIPTKLYRSKDFIIGFTGNATTMFSYFSKLKNKHPMASDLINNGFSFAEKDDGIAALMLTKNGIFEYQYNAFMHIARDYHAVGSGKEFAMMAMHLGKDPMEAVMLTALFDAYTGGGVNCLNI